MINQNMSLQSRAKPRFFYGYLLVALGLVIQITAWGLFNTYGVFFNPLLAEFGWSRAAVSGAPALGQVLIGVGAIFMGRLNDRFGPRAIMTMFYILGGLGCLLMARVNSIWQLYLFYGLMVGIGLSGTDVVLLSIIARWFVKRRGMMSGIVKIGTGAGIMIMPLVATWLISNHGWRTSYVIMAIGLTILTVSAAQFLRRDPAQMGQLPDGEAGYNSNARPVEVGLSLRQAVCTRRFWTLVMAYFTIFLAANTIVVHIAPHVRDMGFSAALAATMLAAVGGASMVGRLVMGITGDRIGHKRAMVVCFVIVVTSLLWLQLAGALWMLFLFVAVFGFGSGGVHAIISPTVADFFGTRSHGYILGFVIFCGAIGGGLGPYMAGYIFDITTSYRLAFLSLLLLAVAGLVLILSSRAQKDVQPKAQ